MSVSTLINNNEPIFFYTKIGTSITCSDMAFTFIIDAENHLIDNIY